LTKPMTVGRFRPVNFVISCVVQNLASILLYPS
jgi:hypothetical protein